MINQTSRFLAREHSGLIELGSRIIDIFSILIAASLVTYLYDFDFINLKSWAQLIFIKILLCLIVFKEANLYRSWRGRPYSDQFSRLTLSYIISSIVIFLLWSALNLKIVINFEQFLLWILLSGIFIFTFRAFVYTFIRQLRKKGVNQKKIVIFGAGQLGKALLTRTLNSPESGFLVTGFIDDKKNQSIKIKGLPVLGAINQLPNILETNPLMKYGWHCLLKQLIKLKKLSN